jgi:hypothetical protein
MHPKSENQEKKKKKNLNVTLLWTPNNIMSDLSIGKAIQD